MIHSENCIPIKFHNVIDNCVLFCFSRNALNIVKDDLIVKLDELTGEIEIMREEMNAIAQSRNKSREKIVDLEEELKKFKEQVKQHSSTEQEDESDVPMAQRKRFTRVEMARVLMERNQVRKNLNFFIACCR